MRRSWSSEEVGAQKKSVVRSWCSEEVGSEKLVLRRSDEVGCKKKLVVRKKLW